MSKLEEGLKKLDLLSRAEAVGKLQDYIGELEKWNPYYSLVNAEGDELIIRHILDSLSGLELIGSLGEGIESPRLADMGSGGGLPGIPLSLFLGEWEIDLVERSGKRFNFLNNMVITLELQKTRALQKDLKEVGDLYDVITFRAFRPFLPEIIRGLKKCLAPEGVIAAYKGKRSAIAEEEDLLRDHFRRIDVIPLKVPFLAEERHLLILGEAIDS
ncbi:MAG: 16S rRNA (guanine(527)-N(7))-methyltransferase RsmG [Spirochaetales bacterium]|nr:16S rRNA (guanine(527)-N(7))-methyltransferase RsmG [Spirochaetales bacterium]